MPDLIVQICMNFIVVHLVFFPRPVYAGPDLVTYFRGPNLEVHFSSVNSSWEDALFLFNYLVLG